VKISLVLLIHVVENFWSRIYTNKRLSFRLWHKAGHINQLFLYFIERRWDLIGTGSWFILLSYLIRRIVESIFCWLHKIIRNFNPLVQWFEIGDIGIIIARAWYLSIGLTLYKHLRLRLFLFSHLSKVFLFLYFPFLILGSILLASNVASRPRG
jgi:hypothetical protein